MRLQSKRETRRRSRPAYIFHAVGAVVLFAFTGSLTLFPHISISAPEPEIEPIRVVVDPNFGVRTQVEAFFLDNNAPEMLPVIACESEFKHYNSDGSVLTNRAGSSATGVAQILASKHPDPKALERYNNIHDMDLTINDFDITTLEGNLGYALVLYEIRGTRDWECAKWVL